MRPSGGLGLVMVLVGLLTVSGRIAIAGDMAEATKVWGATFKQGYGTGEIVLIERGDALYLRVTPAIAPECEAMLAPSTDGAGEFTPVVHGGNARGCDALEAVRLPDDPGDGRMIEIVEDGDVVRTRLGLRNAPVTEAVAPSPSLMIRDVSFGMTLGKMRLILQETVGSEGKDVAVRGEGYVNHGYSVADRERGARDVVMVLGPPRPEDEGFDPDVRPVAIMRHWAPGKDKAPSLDTMEGALVEMYGPPSISDEKGRRFEWHFDREGARLDREAALACSVMVPDASRVVERVRFNSGIADRRNRFVEFDVNLAPGCGISMVVTLGGGQALSTMSQVLYRHGGLLEGSLLRAGWHVDRIIGETRDRVESEGETPKL